MHVILKPMAPMISDTDKEKRLDHFYSIGIDLLSQKSFQKLSVREIAAAAGVSTGGFFHYFATKEDYRTFLMFRSIMPDWLALQSKLKAAESLSELHEALLRYLHEHMHIYTATAMLTFEWFMDLVQVEDSSARSQFEEIQGEFYTFLASQYQRLQIDGKMCEEADAMVVAMMVGSLIDNLLLQDLITKKSYVCANTPQVLDFDHHPTIQTLATMLSHIQKGIQV